MKPVGGKVNIILQILEKKYCRRKWLGLKMYKLRTLWNNNN